MIDLLSRRRSIRRYRPEPLTPEQRAVLEEAVLRSPSSRSINPWHFVFVDNPELLVALSEAKPHGSSFLAGAALGIVVCGDETASDVWVEDCSIASLIAHVTAHSLGLGSCWIQIRKRPHDENRSAEAYVQELLLIPSHLRVESIIAIGHSDEDKPGHDRDSLEWSRIRRNRYA